MVKLIIKVPAICFIEVDKLALHTMSRELQDQVHNLGLIKFFLLGLDILDLNSTFGQIDETLFAIHLNDLHIILGTHSEQLLNILDSFTGGVGRQNECFPIVVLQQPDISTLFINLVDFDLKHNVFILTHIKHLPQRALH